MSLDGFCDHTAMDADDEIHEHYNELLRNAGGLIYGRKTYQLMENHWPSIVKNPTGNKPMDDFAILIDNIPKIVYSRTLKNVVWRNTELKNEIFKEDIIQLKQQAGKDIFVGSPGLIVALTQLDLIDEYQLAIHPTIVGNGLPLFKNITERVNLNLLQTKTFGCGVIVLYYEKIKKIRISSDFRLHTSDLLPPSLVNKELKRQPRLCRIGHFLYAEHFFIYLILIFS